VTTSLVLSGGGSRGYFEFEVARLLYERGWRFDRIYGTSAGAIVAAQVALFHVEPSEIPKQRRLWQGITFDDLFSGGLGFWRAIQMVRGKKFGLYDTDGLLRWLQTGIDWAALKRSHAPGCYVSATMMDGQVLWQPNLKYLPVAQMPHAVLASGSIPGFAEPAKEWMPKGSWAYDGGVRDMTPLSRAISENPDLLVVVLTDDPWEPKVGWTKPRNVLDLLKDVAGQMHNEVWRSDLAQMGRMNELLGLAPPTGRWHRQNSRLLKPNVKHSWPGGMDFSDKAKLVFALEAERVVDGFDLTPPAR